MSDKVEIPDEAARLLAEKIVSQQVGLWDQYTTSTRKLLVENAVPFVKEALSDILPLLAARPLLDREEVRVGLESVWMSASADDMDAEVAAMTDVVVGLARPMPTQTELGEWLQEIFTADPGGTSWDTAAECLLALLRGEQS